MNIEEGSKHAFPVCEGVWVTEFDGEEIELEFEEIYGMPVVPVEALDDVGIPTDDLEPCEDDSGRILASSLGRDDDEEAWEFISPP